VSYTSRVGAWFRRTFGGLNAVLRSIGEDAVPALIEEWKSGGLRSDAQRRAAAERVVSELISIKYPAYGFLVDAAVHFVFESAREQLKRRSK
jgi:hypothetical protein